MIWKIIDIQIDIQGGLRFFGSPESIDWDRSSRSHHRAAEDLQGDQPCDWEPLQFGHGMDGMDRMEDCHDLSCALDFALKDV